MQTFFFFSQELTEPRSACILPLAALFAPIIITFWRVLPFSNASNGLPAMLVFELKPVRKPSRQLARLEPVNSCFSFLSTPPLRKRIQKAVLHRHWPVSHHTMCYLDPPPPPPLHTTELPPSNISVIRLFYVCAECQAFLL